MSQTVGKVIIGGGIGCLFLVNIDQVYTYAIKKNITNPIKKELEKEDGSYA